MTTSTKTTTYHAPAHNIFEAIENPLDKIFKPKNVAIVGATEKDGSVGRTILWNLLSSPFGGTLYPVNPKRENILGLKCYASLSAIEDAIDLVVIVTPASIIPNIIEEAASLGIPGAIIISAGFKEIGEEGIKREAQILKAAKTTGMRIIGPNCLGVMSTTSGLNATFAATMANSGHVGFLSQSGALCTAVLDWSLAHNVGFSVFASIGSMLDVDWGDLIHYLGNDPNTKSIVLYMETIGDAQSFLSAAREVALEKPIIVIKPGRTESAAQAAASHTGSLVGSDAVLDAAFKRCGVLRVNTIEELFAMADVLDKQPLPTGPKLNIITNAGGPGVIATDALITSGGELAEPSKSTVESLNKLLPEAWSHHNPIDILGDASPERYSDTLKVVNEDDNADGTLVILTPQAMTHPRETARAMVSNIKIGEKPILASWMGGKDVISGIEVLDRHGIPTFPYPDTAARAFSAMWQYRKNLNSLYETPGYRDQDSLTTIDTEKITQQLYKVIQSGRSILTEAESKKLLAKYKLPVAPIEMAATPQEAITAASQMDGPVVLKLHSTTITHKSDVGGVQLNLNSEVDIRQAFETIHQNLAARGLSDGFEGVTVQPMASTHKGVELLIGASYDPQFGPVIAFGTGGTYVELFEDIAFGLPPLNSTLVKRLIEQTKISKALEGIRGAEPVDMAEVESVLVRFSYLLINHPEIKEVEINPLLALPGSEGLVALDARVILHEESDLTSNSIQKNVIRAYPYQYISNIALNNGEGLTIRPIRANDETAIREFHKRLTDTDVYQSYNRDFSYVERTNHKRLARICFNDYDRELTLVAVNKQQDIVGVCRLSRQKVDHSLGMFRVIIEPAYQRQGLGKQLMTKMIGYARENEGISTLFANILDTNQPMLNLLDDFGFKIEPSETSNVKTASLILD